MFIFLCVVTAIWPELKARPGQWNLHSRGPLWPQTSIPCQLSPSCPSGRVFSPPPGSPSQSYFSSCTGPFLQRPVFSLWPRPSSSQSTCRCAAEISRGWGWWPFQAYLSPVQQTIQHQAGAFLSPGKELADMLELKSPQGTITSLSVLQGRISMFCSRTCCDQYKTQTNVLATCEHCKQEKVLFDTISYNQQDLTFCSESE